MHGQQNIKKNQTQHLSCMGTDSGKSEKTTECWIPVPVPVPVPEHMQQHQLVLVCCSTSQFYGLPVSVLLQNKPVTAAQGKLLISLHSFTHASPKN